MYRKFFPLILAFAAGFSFPGSVMAVDMKEEYPIPAKDMHMRDPFVIVDEEEECYYIITSRWKDGRGGLAAYKSRDLENWRDEGFVYNAAPDYLGTDDFWAPDTYKYKGGYYVFVTLSNKSKGILRGTTILKSVSGTVLGPYEPVLSPDRLNVTPDWLQCLDGSLYIDDEGKPWMIYAVEWCGPNICDKVGEVWAQRLKDDLTDTEGEPHRLFKASDSPWALHIGGGGMITDAPVIWKDSRSGNLIMTWSSFAPEYSIGQAVSRSGNVLGPWEHEPVPVFSSDGGHQMIFKDLDGNLKISFHSPNAKKGALRETLTIRDISIKDGKFEPLEGTYDGFSDIPEKISNPVRTVDGKPLAVADPFVFRHKGTYYLTGTSGDGGFDYYTSADLVTWEYKGALFRTSQDHPGTAAFWAPEVKRYNGRYYLSYSCYIPERDRMLTCLAVSDSPEGPYRELYTPWFDFGYSAIDAHIFVDDDGTPYLYYSKNYSLDGKCSVGEIYAIRLRDDLSGPEGDPVFISGASQDWEKVKWEVNRCNEGPEVFKHDGRYYMTYSANDTGYEYYGVGISTADTPLGPWKKCKDNPLMTTDLSEGISSPGHNSLVYTPDGQLFIIYHRHADPDCRKPDWNRVVCVDRLGIDRKGRIVYERD